MEGGEAPPPYRLSGVTLRLRTPLGGSLVERREPVVVQRPRSKSPGVERERYAPPQTHPDLNRSERPQRARPAVRPCAAREALISLPPSASLCARQCGRTPHSRFRRRTPSPPPSSARTEFAEGRHA